MLPNENVEYFNRLLSKYLDNKATPEEITFIEKYYQHFEDNAELTDALPEGETDQIQSRILDNLKKEMFRSSKKTAFIRFRWITRAAAIFIFLVSGIIYFQVNNNQEQPASAVKSKQPAPHDILPGTHKAIITLGDGSTVLLDDSATGIIAKQGNTQVVKRSSGEIVYKSSKNSDKPYINTMTTPRGGRYQLTLSDGTKVWMNSASSITYPASFTEPERRVKITGEVYFEVSKKDKQPFHVVINDETEILVLGTHFNVNTYADNEAIAATLLEGSVRIIKGSEAQILKPGQQAELKNNTISIRSGVDTNQVMAWKNGYFSFNNTGLEIIMKQLARWYDVNIIYNGKTPQMKFWGGIRMNSTLSQVLQILEESRVKFRVEDKNIIVLSDK